MAHAAGALTYVGIQAESSWGTAIATPALVALPYTGFSINTVKDVYEDESVQADRMIRYAVHGNHHVQGDIDVNLTHANYDALFESLLWGAFTSNVLKTGTTRKSFLVEAGYTDIGQFISYTGVMVDKLTLTVPTSGFVTAKFTVIGKDETVDDATLDANATLTDATVRQPYVHNGGTFNESGSGTSVITALTLNVDNGYTANFSLGSNYARDITPSFAKVSGTASVWFEDETIYNKFLAETNSSLSFTLTDGTNTLQFNIPKVKYTGGNKSVQGQGPVTIEMPFVGVRDSSAASNIVITRSA